MSQNSCCVPGCAVFRKDCVPLHRFPNPKTSGEKFTTWILNIGGEIAILDHQDTYDNRRVCHRHFADIHKYPSDRLSKLAIPTMHIPGAVLHAFPNPSTEGDKFHAWVVNAGLVGEDDDYIFGNRRICRLHFEKTYHYPKNRLSKLAVPTLHLPEIGGIPKESTDTAELLLFFYRLFDSVNGNYSKIVKGKIYRSAVSPKSPHHKLWHKSLQF